MNVFNVGVEGAPIMKAARDMSNRFCGTARDQNLDANNADPARSVRHTVRRQRLWAAVPILLLAQHAYGGPISPFYMTGTQFGGGPNTYQIRVVQGADVINQWDQYGNSLSPTPFLESPIAVTSSVKTHGGSLCSGVCDPLSVYSAEYTLAGSFVGVSSSTVPYAVPPNPNGDGSELYGQFDYLYDGTTDGVHNYALAPLTRTLYSFDSSWQNPVALFSIDQDRDSLWLGITYDASNDSLWVSTHNTGFIRNYTMAGTLLSSFSMQNTIGVWNLAGGLGLDSVDQTLWVFRDGVRLEQYSKQGAFLGWESYIGLQNFDSLGAEFALGGALPTPVPEPGTLILTLIGGLLAFGARSRAKNPAAARRR